MINPKTNLRELAYIVSVDEIRPIPNQDRVEYARVGGWWVIVRKGQFKVDDLAVYLEIDSKTPEVEPFLFLEKRHYKVKTLKMCGVISQGLLMSLDDFGWHMNEDGTVYISNDIKNANLGYFVTNILGITYADPEDNKRKAASADDKYKKMSQRHPNVFKKPIVRKIMKTTIGRKIMFFFFGKKKDKRGWPTWVVKTDEERVQNLPFLFPENNQVWIATEKIDGTSTTFSMKRRRFNKKDFYICSRNVVFDKPDKKCFYDTNVYLEMAEKYKIEAVLSGLLNTDSSFSFVTLQGETYGKDIQKRDYGLNYHDFAAFNLIFGYTNGEVHRCNPLEMKYILDNYNIPSVPILGRYKIPATCDEVLNYAASAPSKIDGGMREGVVFRTVDGKNSFKAVSNEFLLKYHQ